MTTTVKFLGREFTVTEMPASPYDGLPRYELRGKRGACYWTMRNVHDKTMMFLNGPMSVMKHDVWLTDRNGTLEVVRDR